MLFKYTKGENCVCFSGPVPVLFFSHAYIMSLRYRARVCEMTFAVKYFFWMTMMIPKLIDSRPHSQTLLIFLFLSLSRRKIADEIDTGTSLASLKMHLFRISMEFAMPIGTNPLKIASNYLTSFSKRTCVSRLMN